MNISVCMATYNGEKYIERQLNSILVQLMINDEIIIVDDCSTDNTLQVISEKFTDKRIKIIRNTINLGVNASFEKSLLSAQNEIIFLSDQDDVWFVNKRNKVLHYFECCDVDLIQHDAIVTNDKLDIIYESYYNLRNVGCGVFKNFISNTYLGCSMAFKKTILDACLPIPVQKSYHDRWIGIITEIDKRKVMFIKDKLMYYIRHKKTVSNLKRRKLNIIIYDRIDLLKSIFVFYILNKLKCTFKINKLKKG